MQDVFEKIIEKLNSKKTYFQGFYEREGKTEHDSDLNKATQLALDDAIEIVKQEAEQFNTEREKVVKKLLTGEWVDTKDVEKYLNIEFSEGMHIFDFGRTVEWNSPPLNGQNITTKFRLKNNGWIPCSERLPEKNQLVLVCAESTTISSGTIRMVGAYANGAWFIQNSVDTLGFQCLEYCVVAWQTLPEPYQQNGE